MIKTAYCKINLTLEILGTKRGDGFHDLKSIMHKIPLGDKIEIETKDGEGKVLLTCDSDVCKNEDNLAYKAARLFLERYRKNTGRCVDVAIKLTKITPTGAGLGGGSADAATVLDALQELVGGVSDEESLKMAKELGSDVPFCLGRYMSAYCSGRGEACTSIDTLPKHTHLVVAKPKESINTRGIYGEYDKKYGDDYSKCKTDEMQKALAKGEFNEIAKCIVNDFEEVCIPRLEEIYVIKRIISQNGALCCQMSGSGSAVFGLFDNENDTKACFEALKNEGLTELYRFTPQDFEKMYKGE